MSNNLSQAKLFFEACKTAKRWETCKANYHLTKIWNDNISFPQLSWV